MKSEYSKNPLNRVLLYGGTKGLKAYFQKSAAENAEKALALINDRSLSFPCLYALIPEIEGLNLFERQNSRNKLAIETCRQILQSDSLQTDSGLLFENGQRAKEVLKWMFMTGSFNDGLTNELDKILDITAALLIRNFHDKTILPAVADLIFKRNRKGSLIHDLVWAFFGSCDKDALKLIAERLRSRNPKDASLAATLLRIEPPKATRERLRQYKGYTAWLEENAPYLRFTEDSFQYTSSPTPCRVDLERKYLCKNAPGNEAGTGFLTNEEYSLLENFKQADDYEKIILSKYSHKIHNENEDLWNNWIQSPLNEQIHIAQSGLEGTV